MIRAFLAVELHDTLRAHLARLQADLKQRLSARLPRQVRLSWVQAGSIHLTLKFLGDIDEAIVQPIREAIAHTLQGHEPVSIPLERIGSFPNVQQPRVLWVGPSEQWERSSDHGRLIALHHAVEASMVSLDFAPDTRQLSPHLTLARIKEGARQMGQALAQSGVMDRPCPIGSLPVESIALMKSDLKPTGSVYTKLWEIQF
ncbi:MAG TPA: RNA 2',3'-cyclic phosphodiesterase [Nitrospira sp.]|nr:RNA 2',3'-cyclic phosphodiesterase [Nitrospira sp.]